MKLLSWIKQNIIKEKETLASKCMQQGTSPQARKCWIISLSRCLHLYPLLLIYALVLIFASALMHTTSGRVMADPGIYLQVIYWYILHLWITHFDLHLFFLTFFRCEGSCFQIGRACFKHFTVIWFPLFFYTEYFRFYLQRNCGHLLLKWRPTKFHKTKSTPCTKST